MSDQPVPQEHPNVPHALKLGRGVWIILGVMIIAAVIGIGLRMEAFANLRKRTEELAIANVVVMEAPAGPAVQEIVLPGTVQAWHEAPIFARTSGYLKFWKTDIGAHVAQGDLLAEIEAPEVDAQLHQAEADMASAKANNVLAQLTAKRWKALLSSHAVSAQEVDEKMGAASANTALLASAKANLDRLRQLESFKRVLAPFAGVVTVRNTDTGALINAGSATGQGQELFHVADLRKLRIYVQVPETYAPYVTKGLKAELHFSEYPGRAFAADFLQTADALDPVARTLLVQFATDNAAGDLLPGGYAEVHLTLPASKAAVRLPVNTLLFRAEGLQVATVDDDDRVVLKSIKVSRDFGKEVEIGSGIEVGEQIIVNPPDSLEAGQKVEVLQPKDKAESKAPEAKSHAEKTEEAKPAEAKPEETKPAEVKSEKADDGKDKADKDGDKDKDAKEDGKQ